MRQGLWAGVLYFINIFAVGFAFGILRTMALEELPQVSRLTAVLVEIPIMLAIAWVVCGVLMQRAKIANDGVAGIAMGGSALTMLLIAEVLLSRLFSGLSLMEHLSLYQQRSHLAGLVGQCLFAAFPWVRARLQHRSNQFS